LVINSNMTSLTIRNLLIDLKKPFPARWNGGNAFRSAIFNAFSMSFPVGEQYYMYAVRKGLRILPEHKQFKYFDVVKNFVGQEAAHSKIHKAFNDNLKNLGYKNLHEENASKRLKKFNIKSAIEGLAFTAANEHISIINSMYLLEHLEFIEGSEERLKSMWLWHCAEEIEHRSVAFDLYRDAGGTEKMRVDMYKKVTYFFLKGIIEQTLYNLWKDKQLFKWNTWKTAYISLFSETGIVTCNFRRWKIYMSPNFDPKILDDSKSKEWFKNNTNNYELVKR